MELEQIMKLLGIDPELTGRALAAVNRREAESGGKETSSREKEEYRIPGIDGIRILDRRRSEEYRIPEDLYRERIRELRLPPETLTWGKTEGGVRILPPDRLKDLGLALLPGVAFGVLNGGSASTYADEKKNRDFSPPLFRLFREEFEKTAGLCRGRSKGVTPAFSNPDGSPGPSFLELKLRRLLLLIREYQGRYGRGGDPLYPFVQMTSIMNSREIEEAFEEYRKSPLLESLIRETGVDITRAATGVQPLTAALTHRDDGLPRRIFTQAKGREHGILPFPGGHGQNFAVLKEIYRDLHARGKRYIYLGNVDNLGSTPDLEGIALLALSGSQGAFDFSFRTPVDVKGGILLETREGRLTCADIGAAVSREWTEEQTARGKKLLFNCATGLFSLDWLAENLDRIAAELPLRVTEQDKDPGKYAQTEQITWEVLSMMDRILIFGVDKYGRFLASKLLMENLMLSGIALDHPEYPRTGQPETDLHSLSTKLHRGLEAILTEEYGMKLEGNVWVPVN